MRVKKTSFLTLEPFATSRWSLLPVWWPPQPYSLFQVSWGWGQFWTACQLIWSSLLYMLPRDTGDLYYRFRPASFLETDLGSRPWFGRPQETCTPGRYLKHRPLSYIKELTMSRYGGEPLSAWPYAFASEPVLLEPSMAWEETAGQAPRKSGRVLSGFWPRLWSASWVLLCFVFPNYRTNGVWSLPGPLSPRIAPRARLYAVVSSFGARSTPCSPYLSSPSFVKVLKRWSSSVVSAWVFRRAPFHYQWSLALVAAVLSDTLYIGIRGPSFSQ